ncbi:hypothetical protein [Streptomyces sp. NRRL S-337]|uniref:hypothetical protein n=1 Tax=Streptomyces sp. NRRL S-337 TaxID=1463900 RepID=UPI0004C6454E|nr:hypothetical protein [Streptomyces sp. NRRL S-337]
MNRRYEAHLRQAGRWWNVDIPELALYSQGRTLGEAEARARDIIAGALQVPADDIRVDLVIPEAAGPLQRVRQARAELMSAIAAEQQALAEAVHVLVTQLGLSQRDASRMLGIPQEHVSQIVGGQL